MVPDSGLLKYKGEEEKLSFIKSLTPPFLTQRSPLGTSVRVALLTSNQHRRAMLCVLYRGFTVILI